MLRVLRVTASAEHATIVTNLPTAESDAALTWHFNIARQTEFPFPHVSFGTAALLASYSG